MFTCELDKHKSTFLYNTYKKRKKKKEEKANLATITCGVRQGWILGPLLFLLNVNDLKNTNVLEPIMFADDTNFHFSHTKLSDIYFKQ